MNFLTKKRILVPALLLFLASPLWARQTLSFQIVREGSSIGVEARVHLDNTQEIKNAIRSGVSFKIIYFVELYEKEFGLFNQDKLVRSIQVSREVIYTDLKKSYIVREGNKKFHFKTPNRLYSYLLRYRNSRVASDLDPNKIYRIYVRAKGETVKLYFPLDWVFRAFISLWDFDLGPIRKEFQIE